MENGWCGCASSNTLHRHQRVRVAAQIQQEYFIASEADIEVKQYLSHGYLMRMLKKSPSIGAGHSSQM